MPNDTPTLRLGIGAIFKNECPYILEWIAYHRVLGFSRFFIADNNSDDGSTELLASLAAANIVEHIPFPGQPGKAPQLPAYTEILRRFSNEVDWLAFIDADEFLLPTDRARSLRPYFEELDSLRHIGAVVVNWATYGSSGRQLSSNDLVVERFVTRGNDDWGVNRHYKTVVRSRAASGVKRNPHLIGVHDALETIQTSGEALVNHSEKGEGVSAQIIWDRIRINHFVVKSRQEFFDRKRPRGRATVIGQTRDEAFFLNHDRNEVADPTPTWLVEATRAEISRLARHVTNKRPDTTAVGSQHPQTVRLQSWSRSLKATLRNAVATRPNQATPSRPSTHGAVDKVAINGHCQVQVTGWALLGRSAVPFLSVKLGDQVIEDCQIERRARADVVRHLPGSDLRCGFTMSFPLELIRKPADPAVISVLVSTTMDGETRVVARHAWPPDCVVEKLHASQQEQRPAGVAVERPLGIPTESQKLLWPTELDERQSIDQVLSEPNTYFLAEESEAVAVSQPNIRNLSDHSLQPTGPVFLPLGVDGIFPSETRCPSIYVSHLKDAVCHGSGIITQGERIFTESFRCGVRRGNTSLSTEYSGLTAGLPVIEQPTIFLDGEHFPAFGHFLGEVFSRLWIRKALDIGDLKVAVGKGVSLPHIRELLDCAGLKPSQLVEVKEPTLFRSLVVSSQSHVVRTGLSKLGAEFYGDIADSVDPTIAVENAYISRRLGKLRRLSNEAEAEKTFRALNFDVIVPELLTARAQISLFRHARRLAGPSGSNLFGMLFAKRAQAALILTPSAYILHNDVVLTSRSKAELSYLVSHSNGIQDDWTVDKTALSQFAHAWLDTTGSER